MKLDIGEDSGGNINDSEEGDHLIDDEEVDFDNLTFFLIILGVVQQMNVPRHKFS